MGVGFGVRVAVGVAVGVAVSVAVGVGVGVAAGVAVGVGVGVAVGVAVGAGVGVAVGAAVGVGVGVAAAAPSGSFLSSSVCSSVRVSTVGAFPCCIVSTFRAERASAAPSAQTGRAKPASRHRAASNAAARCSTENFFVISLPSLT